MESSNFDFDINNYNVSDLINFFSLQSNYTIEMLEQKVSDMQNKIFSIENSQFNPKYKFDIANFIKLAKDVLISAYFDIEAQKEIQKLNSKPLDPMRILETKVGNIMNPLGIHPALQDTMIHSRDINGYNYNNTFTVYIFNTVMRDNFFNTSSTDCTFTLPLTLKNVLSITLTSLELPNVFFAFSAQRGTNRIFIYEDTTGLNGVVTLPDGNYSSTPNISPGTPNNSISFALEDAINSQVLGITDPSNYRFFVTVNPATNFTEIFNTTHTFTMKILTDNSSLAEGDFCNPYVFNSRNVDNASEKNNKLENNINIKPSQYTNTLGYLLGFRGFTYSGSDSYTSESTFNGQYSSNYLYFSVNDYTGSQQKSNTYGVLQNSLIDDNVLAFVTLNASSYSYIFNNSGDLIYKRRLYYGPVDISKISIKLLDQYGQVVNLLQNEFSFGLTVYTNYNLKTSMVPIINPII